MNPEKVTSHNPGTSSTSEKHLEELRLKLAEAAERLHAIRMHAGVEEASAGAHILANLEIVKQSMVAAETAMAEYAQHAAIATNQYVQDSIWNWRRRF